MSTENSAARNTVANDRRIDDDRLERALAQDMDVREHAPAMYDVRHDDETYTVDVEGGSCGCKDHEFRGDRVVCKHVLRAAIHHVYVAGVDTRFVARVVRATDALGCVHDTTGCNGPVALDDRDTVPCADCCAATGTGLWTVYCTLANQRDRLDAETDSVATGGETAETGPVAMTDGGTVTVTPATDDDPEAGIRETEAGEALTVVLEDRRDGADANDTTTLELVRHRVTGLGAEFADADAVPCDGLPPRRITLTGGKAVAHSNAAVVEDGNRHVYLGHLVEVRR